MTGSRMYKNVLFVCSADKQRSNTGVDFFSDVFPKYQFKSAGIRIDEAGKEVSNEVTEKLLIWADYIFVMEDQHREIILKNADGKYGDKIFVLSIPDEYTYYQPELIAMLKKTTHIYFR